MFVSGRCIYFVDSCLTRIREYGTDWTARVQGLEFGEGFRIRGVVSFGRVACASRCLRLGCRF